MPCASDGPPAPQVGVAVDWASVSHPASLCTTSEYTSTGEGLPDLRTPCLSSHSSAEVLTVVLACAVLSVGSGSGVLAPTEAAFRSTVPWGTAGETKTVMNTVLDAPGARVFSAQTTLLLCTRVQTVAPLPSLPLT